MYRGAFPKRSVMGVNGLPPGEIDAGDKKVQACYFRFRNRRPARELCHSIRLHRVHRSRMPLCG
jgi:hypothetical protein